jgi:hypothetical protein
MTIDDLVGDDDTLDVSVLAVALRQVSPAAVLSHRSAAQVWGLWIPRFDGIEVTTPAVERGSRYTTGVQRRSIVAHRRIISAADVTTRYGLPVTSLARTWLDLAPLLDLNDLVAAGDCALRLGAAEQELAERAHRAFRTRGAIRARQAAPLLNGRSKSRPESRIRAALVLGGLPEPKVNEAVHDSHGGWLAEPDLHYDEARLAIEFNGAVHIGVERQRKDSIRTLDLQRERWKVLVYTTPHAFGRLHEVVDDVRANLQRRAPTFLAEHLLRRSR